MTTATAWPADHRSDWPARIRNRAEGARDWLDTRGRPAWLMAMVAGFILFWPIGLALLFYMIWSNRMSCMSRKSRYDRRPVAFGDTGNHAFDSYRAETLKRLEEEHEAFLNFLGELRAARDRAEFDQFMARRDAPQPPEAPATA
jgi:hypothetical protein